MAFVGESRRNLQESWKNYVCLSKDEAQELLPLVDKLLQRTQKRWEYYNDIHESGEATSRQETARENLDEKIIRLESIKAAVNEILR